MDDRILDYIIKNFVNVNTFVSSSETPYIVGEIDGFRYMISKQRFYIVTKQIDNIEKYVGVYETSEEVCNLLKTIKEGKTISANDKAKILASITKIPTI